MALPTSRNTTYSALSQVKSADLNDVQDWIIDHETRIVDHEARLVAGSHDAIPISVSLEGGDITGGAPARESSLSFYRWTFANSGEEVIFEVPAVEGMTLSAVRMRCNIASTAVLTIAAYPVTDGVVGSALAGGTASTSGSGGQTVLRTFTTPRTLAAGEKFLIGVSYSSGAGFGDLCSLDAYLER